MFSPVTAKLLLKLLSSSVPVDGTLHKHIKTETHGTMSAFFLSNWQRPIFGFSSSLSRLPWGFVRTPATAHSVVWNYVFCSVAPSKISMQIIPRENCRNWQRFFCLFLVTKCSTFSSTMRSSSNAHMPNHILPDTKPFRMTISANTSFRPLHRHWIKCSESVFSGHNQSFPSELFRSWPWWHRVNV